jgi:hypothetical protein
MESGGDCLVSGWTISMVNRLTSGPRAAASRWLRPGVTWAMPRGLQITSPCRFSWICLYAKNGFLIALSCIKDAGAIHDPIRY